MAKSAMALAVVLAAAWTAMTPEAKALGILAPILGMHRAVLPSLVTDPALSAVVRLETQSGEIQSDVCTATFISDSHVITAAHCFANGPETSLFIPKTDTSGDFWNPGESREIFVSEAGGGTGTFEDLDVAVVRFPRGTFTGRPMAVRLTDAGLRARLADAALDVSYRTYGYGLTEGGEGTGADALRSREIPRTQLELGEKTFTTRDEIRVDHGDSGGPVLATITPAPAPRSTARPERFLMAVNHAYSADRQATQYFKPLPVAFFARLTEEGKYPGTRCDCVTRHSYRQLSESGRVLNQWREDETARVYKPLGVEQSCTSLVTPAATSSYSGEDEANGSPTTIQKKSEATRCRATALQGRS